MIGDLGQLVDSKGGVEEIGWWPSVTDRRSGMSSFDGRIVIMQAVKLGDGINDHLVGRGPADADEDWASKYRGKSDTPGLMKGIGSGHWSSAALRQRSDSTHGVLRMVKSSGDIHRGRGTLRHVGIKVAGSLSEYLSSVGEIRNGSLYEGFIKGVWVMNPARQLCFRLPTSLSPKSRA